MFTEYIREKANKKVWFHDTRDPFMIGKESRIHVKMRYDFKRLKGMYSIIKRNRFIFINGNFQEQVR